MTLKRATSPAPTEPGLRGAFDEAVAFAAAAVHLNTMSEGELQRALERDLAANAIVFDERGLTEAAYDTVVVSARRTLHHWQALRGLFLARLEPRRADIDAVQQLPHRMAELHSKRASEIDTLRQRWAEQPRHALITQQWEVGQAVYQSESLRHGQRLANMAAYSPFYWMGLLLIGIAEWLINYDTFLIFTGVVAIAAGATIVLAVLLAFAAHGHGEMLKQWSYRFGRFQTRQNRVGSWRMLALSTFAVIVVLSAAGGSRYAAVLRTLSQTQQPDLIGGGYHLEFNPLRDVLLSLLANIAAWIVGVFISYFCHDVDPEFMAATYQHRRSGRTFFRARRRLEEETQVIQERTAREATAMENSAFSRRSATETERNMLAQIAQHDVAITEALLTHLRSELARYRAELLRALQSHSIPLASARTGSRPEPISPETASTLPLVIDAALLEHAA